MKRYARTVLGIMVIFFTLTGIGYASPAVSSDTVVINISDDGIIHAIVDKKIVAEQSFCPITSLTSCRVIAKKVATSYLNPVVNNQNLVRAQTVKVVNGVMCLGPKKECDVAK